MHMGFYRAALSVLLAGLVGFACTSRNSKLPIYGPRQITNVSLEGGVRADTAYHTIPDFAFTDQDSTVITQDTFEDKIYVADFFFTTCPTICPIMKTQMLRVYEAYKDNDQVFLLSHSIDPVHDSVAVLREFAGKLGVDSYKWHFVTGPKEEIYEIGQESYMVTAMEDENEPGGYLHSGAFLLIDKDRRIRGIYDGTVGEEVDQLIADIPRLLAEYGH